MGHTWWTGYHRSFGNLRRGHDRCGSLIAGLGSRALHAAATHLKNTSEELFTVSRLKEQEIAPVLLMVGSTTEMEFSRRNQRAEVHCQVDR